MRTILFDENGSIDNNSILNFIRLKQKVFNVTRDFGTEVFSSSQYEELIRSSRESYPSLSTLKKYGFLTLVSVEPVFSKQYIEQVVCDSSKRRICKVEEWVKMNPDFKDGTYFGEVHTESVLVKKEWGERHFYALDPISIKQWTDMNSIIEKKWYTNKINNIEMQMKRLEEERDNFLRRASSF